VIAFRDGDALTGFVGALGEAEVNEFIDSILPSEAEMMAEEAEAEAQAGDVRGAEQRYRDALERDPGNRDATIGLARILADRGELDSARDMVRPLLPDPEAERVMSMVRVREWASQTEPGTL